MKRCEPLSAATNAGGVSAALHGQPGQLQPGGPALGALSQAGQVRLRQGQPHAVAQERGDFGPGEAQVGASHLGQLVAGAQPGQRQRGVLARHQRQMEARRRVRQQALQHRQDGRVLDGVEVVKDADKGRAKPFGSSKTRRVWRQRGVEVVEQGRHQRRRRRQLAGQQRGQQLGADGRVTRCKAATK